VADKDDPDASLINRTRYERWTDSSLGALTE
jgi:hypothetical protein